MSDVEGKQGERNLWPQVTHPLPALSFSPEGLSRATQTRTLRVEPGEPSTKRFFQYGLAVLANMGQNLDMMMAIIVDGNMPM